MKKSEKIEIRMSFDEKEKLTQLAESEGQSVSELVRGLARKYAQLNMPRPRPRMSRLHMLGLVLCGLGIGAGVSFSFLKADKPKTTYMVHGVLDGYGFGFPVQNQSDKLQHSVTLGEGPGAYTINIVIEPENDEEMTANVNICQQLENDCAQSAQADLRLGGGISPSVWQTDVDEKQLFLVVQPAVSG